LAEKAKILATKWFWLIACGAALAAFAQPASAGHASRHRKAQIEAPVPDDTGYYVPYVADIAGNRLPIMQIPGSVTVVPRQVIDDQQAITVRGGVRNVRGIFYR
jgi:catecholate siderophore receptor